MWIGFGRARGVGGLAKFDGEDWAVYNTDNSGLSSNGIQSLAVDSQGNLWVGTRADLAVYREGGVILSFATTILEGLDTDLPPMLWLGQNHPNPFNAHTVIRYSLSERGAVRLCVYNLAGQRIRTLVHGYQSGGAYALRWDGRDNIGRAVASGVYVYRLEIQAGTVQARRMVLLR